MFSSRPVPADAMPKPADHALIAAAAAVRQARTPTARAATALDGRAADRGSATTLVAVMRARGAAGGGSFHPDVARKR